MKPLLTSFVLIFPLSLAIESSDFTVSLVQDINPGPSGSYPTSARPFGEFPINNLQGINRAFFLADDGTHGREPWISDGTSEGTFMLRDVNPGPDSSTQSNSGVSSTFFYAGRLYFEAVDSNHGNELWVTDGTFDGTYLLKDIVEGPGSSNPSFLGIANNVLLFSARTEELGGELYATDGTPEGTKLVKDIFPGSEGNFRFGQGDLGGRIVFSALSPTTNRFGLFVTDGTTEGTIELNLRMDLEVSGSFSAPIQGQVLFGARDVNTKISSLWTTDGTQSGTYLILDSFDTSSTTQVKAIGEESAIIVGRRILQGGESDFGEELYQFNFINRQVTLVRDISPGSQGSAPRLGAAVDNVGTVFLATDEVNGQELWSTNGTLTTTRLVHEFQPGIGSPSYRYNEHFPGSTGFFMNTADEFSTYLWYVDAVDNFKVVLVKEFIRAPDHDTNPLNRYGVYQFIGQNKVLVPGYTLASGVEMYVVSFPGIMQNPVPPSGSSSAPGRLLEGTARVLYTALATTLLVYSVL